MIREMTRADVVRVALIARGSLPEAWDERGYASELEKATSLCLVAGDPIVGFAIASMVLDEMEVLAVAVDPALRRAGTGRALLDTLLHRARARGVLRCHLEVRASNAPAIALYERAGFVRTGMRARYYADGEDAQLMASSLAT